MYEVASWLHRDMAANLAESSHTNVEQLAPVTGGGLLSASSLDATYHDAPLKPNIAQQPEAGQDVNLSQTEKSLPQAASIRSGEGVDEISDLRQNLQHQINATLVRRHARQSSCWNDVRLLRSQVRSAWERFHRYRAQYRESRRLYEREMDPITVRCSGMSLIEDIDSLRSRFDSDRERLEQQCAEAISLEKQLEARENDLEAIETDFLDAASKLVLITQQTSDSNVDQQLHVAESARPDSPGPHTPRLDPLLERYYDKAGDVKIMCERLLDLDEWRQEAVATRELLADRGEPLPIADDDFEKEYLRRRTIIEEEVNIVIAEADKLREKCEKAGLDVNAWQRAIPDVDDDAAESSVFHEDDQMVEIAPVELTPSTFPEAGRSTKDIVDSLVVGPAFQPSSSENDFGANARVARWVGDVLSTSAPDTFDPSVMQRHARPALAETGLTGSTAVPSLASWGQTASTKQILSAAAQSSRSKSDTIVTILKQKGGLDEISSSQIDKDLAEPRTEPAEGLA